jgi:hypothetical protein
MVGSYIMEPEACPLVYTLDMSLEVQDTQEYDGWQGGEDFSSLFRT